MNHLDLIILVPVLYGLVRGLFRGLVGEVVSLGAIILGVVGARLWADDVSTHLLELIEMSQEVARLVAYLVVFVIIALTLNLVGKLIERLLKAIFLGGINKLFGAVFGALKLALVASVLLNGFAILDERFELLKPEQKEASILYEPVKQLAAVAWEQIQS